MRTGNTELGGANPGLERFLNRKQDGEEFIPVFKIEFMWNSIGARGFAVFKFPYLSMTSSGVISALRVAITFSREVPATN